MVMKEDFDDRIKEIMDAYRTEGERSDWAAFEQKLEMAELEADLSFDANVAERMDGIRIDEGADWESMEALINTERNRRWQVYRLKATELFIFLLLLFTIFRIYPLTHPKATADFTPLVASHEPLKTKANHNDKIKGDIVKNEWQTEAFNGAKFNDEVGNTKVRAQNDLPPTERLSASVDGSAVSSARITFLEDDLSVLDGRSRHLPEEIELIKIPAISAEVAYTSDEAILFEKVKPNKNLFGKSIWLNVFAGMNMDVITTPYDEVYGLDAYTQLSGSNSLGASISFYQELLEWETGLTYSRKQFQPKLLVKEISGRSSGDYAETSLQNISFSILQIPLQMKYHFISYKGWRTYAMLGSGLNVVIDANYDVRLKILSDTPDYVGPTPVQAPSINDKEFTNGVLENGSFYSNSFFTLNTGLGVQKAISGNMAVFIEQSYQHHLFSGGIGPNANKMNNFTLVTGIKTNIYR